MNFWFVGILRNIAIASLKLIRFLRNKILLKIQIEIFKKNSLKLNDS